MTYIKFSFIALIGWGFWAVGVKIATRYLDAPSTSFWICLWSIILLSVLLIFKRNLMVNKYVFWTIPIGFFSVVAILAFYTALKIGPASVVIPLTNLYVIFPVLYGFIFLKEAVTTTRILGIFFAVLASILLSI